MGRSWGRGVELAFQIFVARSFLHRQLSLPTSLRLFGLLWLGLDHIFRSVGLSRALWSLFFCGGKDRAIDLLVLVRGQANLLLGP